MYIFLDITSAHFQTIVKYKQNFYMHWETKKKKKHLCDLIYCGIRFITVVWNRAHDSSEVYLYLEFNRKFYCFNYRF